MYFVKKELRVLLRLFLSFWTAGFLAFFIAALSGEDLINNQERIRQLDALSDEISAELEGGIDKRLAALGEVPEVNPYRKFYCIEMAKELQEISNLSAKQRIQFDNYDVRQFDTQFKRIMGYTEQSAYTQLQDELELIKRELKNSMNLLDKQRKKLIRQRNAFFILFFILWIGTYLYFSRGIIFRENP
jgi:hypothetical protein